MISRRAFLGGLAVAGCHRAPPASRASWPRTNTYAGVEMIELLPHDADEQSPLVVAIHGLGDRPGNWVEDWSTFPARAQIALPRAFDAYGSGYSWFRFADGMTDAEFGAAVGAAEARLWPAIAAIAGKRRPIITGFSQGGILSYAIASRHPDQIARAFPVAGACPGPLLPQNKARAAPLLAFHGTRDQTLQIKWDRETVAAFKAQGNEAELREYEGVGHQMTTQIHQELWSAIVAAL